MKQVIIILAMLVLTISANSQNVSLWINGQAYAYPATQLVDVPGVGQMTAQQAMQYYPQPQQQPVQLPVTGGNYQQNQLNDLNNQLTLDNKALQNKLLKKQISKMNWDIGTNAVTTLINGVGTGYGIYNATRQTNANLRLMDAQGNYLENIINGAGCCGGSNPGVTPPIVGGTNPIYYPPGVTVFYDNRDGNGPFYVLNGQRVYTVAPPGVPINYGHAGQTPTNNGWNSSFGFPNGGGNPAYNQQQISYTQRSIDQMYFTGNMNPGH